MITFLVAPLIAFLITLFLYPPFIRRINTLQYGQQIREEGPAAHRLKAGTPTMGGVVFLAVFGITALLFAGFSPLIYPVLISAIGCGALGFWDDYLKIIGKQSLGLKARYKLLGEVIVALVLMLALHLSGNYSPELVIPGRLGEINLSLLYPLFVFFFVSAATNAVNLTDGVDGLAAGLAIIAFTAYIYISFNAGMDALALVCGVFIGSCLAFLVFNRYPARVFMGDVGSLGIGGAFAALALLTKTELLFIIIGGVFVVETLAVIVQVASFQLTGKRVFLMAPLHHHFELKGWSEKKVVLFFWGAGALCALIGIVIFVIFPAS